MTRRGFLLAPLIAAAQAPLAIPVLHINDARARLSPERLRRFTSVIWPEAVRDFARCGVALRSRLKSGEVRRSPGGRPRFEGLERGLINLILTDGIPLHWDRGRGLQGAAARVEGFDLCLVPLNEAHPHQVPFLSVNTCVHEILHILLDDVAESRPGAVRGLAREVRVDFHATRLWLFGEGAEIQRAAQAYAGRLGARQNPSQT